MRGMSKMKRFLCVGVAVLGTALLTSGTADADDVIWDGVTANWNSANWDSGQTASAVFDGRTNGVRNLSDVYITSGTVTYDPNTYGDWNYRGGGTMNLSGGATLQMDSDDYWTEFDGDALNIDNATFRRGVSAGAVTGGPMMLGSWGAYDGQKIAVNISNGGSFQNDGQVWFGAPDDNDPIEATMTITGGGSVDLTGGANATIDNDGQLLIAQDLAFCYGHDGTALKGEKYSVNFKGAGTLTTDNGIIAPIQNGDVDGTWTTNVTGVGNANTLLSYSDLSDAGILQARGVSGNSGIFSKYFTVSGTSGSTNYTITSTVPTATTAPITWDGGDGMWNSANWTAGGTSGQTALQVTGRTHGSQFGTSAEQGIDVFITSGTVTYNTTANGDFRFEKAGTLNLSGAATLQMDSTDAGSPDGSWTRWNGEAINITDGATYRRGFGGGAQSGGVLILGTWGAYTDQKMEINISKYGSLVNDGQVWFGCPSDSSAGLEITMTIDGGSVDLTGGDNYVQDNDGKLLCLQDLVFTYNYDSDAGAPNGETYAINFTGGGTFTVDDGIIAPVMDSSLNWTSSLIGGSDPQALLSYEDLWDNGILQALGLSGLDGETFGDYFTVTGLKNADDYTLTSLFITENNAIPGDANFDGIVDDDDAEVLADNWLMSGAAWKDGDFTGDGVVDQADATLLAANWQSGTPMSSIPEPGTVLLLVSGLALVLIRRKR